MKLVELLAKELDEWPLGAEWVVQEKDKELYCAWGAKPCYSGIASWRDGNDGDGMYFENTEPTRLAEDWKTAIITREMWEAECNGVWIAWGGGECPVEKGLLVDVRFRSGDVAGECGAGTRESAHGNLFAHYWEHSDSKYDIVAYRLHKPAQQEQEEMTPCEPEALRTDIVFPSGVMQVGQLEGPIMHRDTIIHCQAIIEDCQLDIAKHTEALASEGFELIGQVPVEDMSDWRNWMVGDLIDVKGDDCASDGRFAVHSFDDDEDVTMNVRLAKCGWPENTSMKWHSRP